MPGPRDKTVSNYLKEARKLSEDSQLTQTSEELLLHAHEPLFLISQLKEGTASSVALYTTLDKPYLVLSRTDHLSFFEISTNSENSCYLSEKFRLDGDTIQAMVSVKMDGTEAIMTYDTSHCISLITRHSATTLVKEIIKINPKGHQSATDSKPVLVHGSGDFMVLYCFQGYIHILYPPAKASSKRKRNFDPNWSLDTVSVGTLVIQKMVALSHNFIAILYRDFNFNYSLRYYEIDPHSRKTTLYKQFDEFEAPPSCLISPEIGGVLVLTGAHMFYFAQPRVAIALDNAADDSLSINTDENVITKDLLAQHPDLISEIFVSNTVIDKSRVLLVSNTGMTYMVYIRSQVETAKFLVFNGIDIIKLGRSTIPIEGGLFHISESLFFQVSNISRSIAFQVLPDTPHINICGYLESSPPILDIDTDKSDLLVCQGGYEAAEFGRYTPQNWEMEPVASLELETTLVRANVVKNAPKFIVESAEGNQLYEYKRDEIRPSTWLDPDGVIQAYYISPSKNTSLTFSGSYMKKSHQKASLIMGDIVKQDLVVYVTRDLELVVQSDSTSRLKLPAVPSWIQTVLVESSLFIAVLVPKGMLFFTYESDTLTQISLELMLPCSAPVLVNLEDNLFLLGINEEDNGIEQVRISPADKSYKVTNIRVGLSNCLGITQNAGRIMLWDSSRVYSMEYHALSNWHVVTQIAEFDFEITDVKILDPSHVLVMEPRALHVFKLDKIDGNHRASTFSNDSLSVRTLRSNHLIIKSIKVPRTVYSVAITHETAEANKNGNIKQASSLALIDNRNMTLVHKCTDSVEYVDICCWEYVYEDTERIFVFALSNCNSNRSHYHKNDMPLHVFEVVEGTIKKIDTSPSLSNILQNHQQTESGPAYSAQLEKVTLQSLKILDLFDTEIKFSIGGSINFVLGCSLETNYDSVNFTYEIDTTSVNQTPVYPIAQCISKGTVFHADVRDGIFTAVNGDLQPLVMTYSHNFITAMDCISDILVSGDAHGNVSILEDTHQCTAFNLGDQINTIKAIEGRGNWFIPVAIVGTLNGGLYKVSRVDGSISQKLLECYTELESALGSQYQTLDWKDRIDTATGTTERKEHFGVVDMKLIERFLADETRIGCAANQSLHQRLVAYKCSLQHVVWLQTACVENASVWPVWHIEPRTPL